MLANRLGSTIEAGQRWLVMSERVRPFMWQGRQYAHTSAVPLSYLSMSTPTWDFLQRFATPTRVGDLLVNPSPADTTFLEELVTAGILVDAEGPDPVHSFTPRSDAVKTLVLYPTSSCNLRCVYCYATSGPGSGPRLSPEHALMAIDDFFARMQKRNSLRC